MSNSFWMQDGKVIVADGAVIYCEDCPCEQDCYADLIAAIRERQVAAESSILGENAIIDLYTAIQEVNFIAPKFIGPLWTGGEVNPPVMLTNSYADSAATFCELYDLVRAMTHTSGAGHYTYKRPYGLAYIGQGYGDNGAGYETKELATAYALADIHPTYWAYEHMAAWEILQLTGGERWAATISFQAFTISITNLPYSISRAVRCTMKYVAPFNVWGPRGEPSWNDQGSGAVENEYMYIDTLHLPVGVASANSPPGRVYGWVPPGPLNSSSPSVEDHWAITGLDNGGEFVTVKWGFHHL